jgi:hypothetical protein
MTDSDTNNIETKTLEAKCHCGSVHFTVNVPVSSLPLLVHLCHCSFCRFSIGAPCVFHTKFPGVAKPDFIAPSSEANIKDYKSGDLSTWKFCATCGAHVASHPAGKNWVFSTSIFTDHSPSNFYIGRHIFSKSNQDGGIAHMLPYVGGRELADINPPEGDPRGELVMAEPEVGQHGEDRLRAQCHCGGVSFTFGRPTEEDRKDDMVNKYISPSDENKWLATFDVCNDCRLVNGNHVVGWTFIPTWICEPSIKPDLKIGTAKTYSSSPGVLRAFCGECGATVFYWTEERRMGSDRGIVDVATGILRAPEGSMAQNWLTWRSRLAHPESGREFDTVFVDALIEGSKKWGLEKCGQESNYSIPQV